MVCEVLRLTGQSTYFFSRFFKTQTEIIIIIIISHLLHKNKSQVLTIQMADMQMEQARSYELIQGLVPRAG